MQKQLDVEMRLIETEKQLKRTKREFQLHDNYEDMHEIEHLKREIDVLKWVLQ